MAGLGARHRRAVADEAFVRQLFEDHGNAMLTYATRLTGDRGIAEDVFQEALLRAWRNPDGLANGKCWMRKWLLTVVDQLVHGTATVPKAMELSPDVATWLRTEPASGSAMPRNRTYRTWRLTGATRRRWP